jgi:phage terminase Nu1 subunit (DNA packaging protein)
MNDSQLIDAMGGTAKVAALCKVSMAAVSQWRDDGIPEARRMFLELARPDVFPQAEKPRRRKADKAE